MHCHQCDTRNDATARFCRVCGTSLDASEQIASTGRPAYTLGAAVQEPECLACGRTNPTGARFCVYCATLLSPSVVAGGGLVYAASGGAAVQAVPTVTLAIADPATLLVRAIWFGLIGWWLGLLWTLCAWLFNLTLIGLPVGLMMLHAIPTVTSLHRQSQRQLNQLPRSVYPAHPLALRAIWFVLIGWWASLIWTLVAFGCSLTFILMPISFWMWNRVPTILTLAQEP